VLAIDESCAALLLAFRFLWRPRLLPLVVAVKRISPNVMHSLSLGFDQLPARPISVKSVPTTMTVRSV